MNVSLRRAVGSLVVLLGSAAILLAKQPQPSAQPRAAQPRVQPGQPTQPGQFTRQPGQPGAQAQQIEPSIVTLLIIDNNKEIALGQLGEQTSKNDDVKHFAQMIAKDHSDFVQKLQERTGGAGRRLGGAPGGAQPATAAGQPASATGTAAADQPRTGAAQPRTAAQPGRRDTTAQQERTERDSAPETRTAQDKDPAHSEHHITVAKPIIGNQPGAQLLQLCQEVADKCLESARKDAGKLSSEEFDKHFIGGQIMAHKEMLDKLQVFQQHVGPETAQLLADARETTQKHLEEAKEIMDSLLKHSSQ